MTADQKEYPQSGNSFLVKMEENGLVANKYIIEKEGDLVFLLMPHLGIKNCL